MRTIHLWIVAAFLVHMPLVAQAPNADHPKVITMDEEPHHHRALHNEYVNVFKVEVAPGDSIVMHQHDNDTAAIAIGDQDVTVGVPGKPDVHQKNADGQVRLQRVGYVHSTRVDGATAYHTVAVELLRPQGNPRNLCAQVIAGQPLNCPKVSPGASSATSIGQPQFESDQTRIQIARVLPHQSVDIGHLTYFQLIVALDPASISPASGKGPDQKLHPGDFIWFDKGGPSRLYKNGGKKEARFVELAFSPVDPSHQLLNVPGSNPAVGRLARVVAKHISERPAQEHF